MNAVPAVEDSPGLEVLLGRWERGPLFCTVRRLQIMPGEMGLPSWVPRAPGKSHP